MEFEQAKEKAVKFIGISKKTAFEVRSKLKRINVTDSTIDKVIEYLSDLGYINDEEYIQAFIKQSIKMEKHSIYEIKQKLLIKGISKELIYEHVDKLHSTDYEKKVVDKLLINKLANMDKDKQNNYIYRRGFRLNGEGNY